MIPILAKMLMPMIITIPMQVQMMFISMLVIKTRLLLMLTQMLMTQLMLTDDKNQAVIDADTDADD